ncbi:monosaccharide ABC transporter substrate-binding protein, CUT2 family [Micromonospora pallida]|uniref:Monosaccharide ABC transporter substrate-binding protein, CUT2 family n=1 Tax=Micromonospora pallida TaxID=145854 RepID=A0A1C6RWQ9_9ACTN|nr:substrate-binding domain-containing protein [Micromonospora pallida]SCL21662.1 monosaccharide ABC transporter substrate-binding protein, CUT2 family [Micromonospora pallida]
MKMSVLRRVGIAAVPLALLATTACGAGDPAAQGGDGEKQLRVGVTVYDMSSFISQGQEGMNAYAKANNIQLLWNSAGGDVSTQASQVDQLINQKVDAIIIVPVQADSLGPQMAAAKAADIPVIAVNTALAAGDALTSAVLPDDVAAGAQEMEMMAKKLNGKGNIVILQGPLGSSPELDRTKGIEQTLAKYPDIKVLAKDTANWKRDEAVNKTKNWLSSFGDQLDGIVSENDDMGLGAVQALAEAGKQLPVVGIDGIQDGLDAVKNGTFIGSSLQHGRVEMSAGLAVAQKVANGETVEKKYTYTMPAITPENVDKYYANVVSEKDAFLQRLPELIAKNLASGDIANEE